MKISTLLKLTTGADWRPVPNANHLGYRINAGHRLVVMGSMNYDEALLASHCRNALPTLVVACNELIAAQKNSERVVKNYPAGTCNCEDAHRDAGNRLEKAERAFKLELRLASNVKYDTD